MTLSHFEGYVISSSKLNAFSTLPIWDGLSREFCVDFQNI